ncbi:MULTISPECIES: 16S rRNA (guanine(527)-N(7))-methyltransferase RsmG [Virgibacillus]|uniref:Ribosomal RNA small subunit methyltransferase G n=1 Tax=Virgibacillus dokdonensis TaxID=302167 RepID=A0A2K9IXT1_9BACI|nr:MULTISPECIES: 16S rRNA (guanine(527)-N(7))-methyltransferase RsmG [Virgibacillus]AUJ24559.1 Ribosomal RNA small subunit methyltransferase G [Virgibacillus dokdonensis]NWO13110.1 16S rRNA (guanine(527)-N(7))-methyltransferase RsmG [Virgibacillus sp.]
MKREQIFQVLEEKGIKLTAYQKEQFSIYYTTLMEWNEKINLTGLTEEADVYLKHFYDSISAAFYFNFNHVQSICDVGAGAGFPSIPLKICFPHLEVTIVDSLKKRIGFLNELSTALSLEKVAFYHDRAENMGKNAAFRETFDVVTARAVARMSVLSELCLPLTKKQGTFLAMKGAKAGEEIELAKPAIEVLGGELKQMYTFTLPEEESERSIIEIYKARKTPKKYPRKAGLPNKEPIE